MNIRDLQNRVHQNAISKGFWDDACVHKGIIDANKINVAEKIALIHSELSEALEGDRSGDKGLKEPIPYRLFDQMQGDITAGDPTLYKKYKEHVGFELADALIRILDLAGGLGYDLSHFIATKTQYNATRPYKHGKAY